MKYELAKKLKDAGFPFDFTPASYKMATIEKNANPASVLATPTLSELIEACGNKFDTLSVESPDEWSAENRCQPEIAVANLWLELNKTHD